MNLFISADDNFLLPAKVMLTSFLVNNRQEFHNIYFLYSSMQQENLSALNDLVSRYEARFIPVFMDESDFSGFHTTKAFPLLVYFRLMIPHHLPESEDRAIWMDVDLVVNGSLEEFYHQNLGDNYLAACRDIGAQERPALLGCPPDTAYVNTGVLLYNVAAMRRYALSDFYQYYLDHRQNILWPDQDIINGMFAGKIKVWDCDIYNVQIVYSPESPKYDLPLLRSSARVIHFIGRFKPWKKDSLCTPCAIWDDYYLMTSGQNALYALYYRTSRRFLRWFQREVVYRLRILHGMVHEFMIAHKS